VPAQALADRDRQALSREEIDHGQRSEPPAIRELVGDKIHAPDVVARRRRSSLLAMHGRHVAPRTLPPQGRAFLGIDPIKALFADDPALTLQEYAETAIPEPHPRLCQLAHTLTQGDERILPTSVVHRRSRRPDHETRPPRAHGVPAHQVLHDLTLLDRL
jgi:hypothetical protein